MYVCMYRYMYVCTYVRMYVRTYVRKYVRMYVCMYVCTYVCVCIYIYIHIHTHVYFRARAAGGSASPRKGLVCRGGGRYGPLFLVFSLVLLLLLLSLLLPLLHFLFLVNTIFTAKDTGLRGGYVERDWWVFRVATRRHGPRLWSFELQMFLF